MGEAIGGICPCGGEVDRSQDDTWHDGFTYPCTACGREFEAEVSADAVKLTDYECNHPGYIPAPTWRPIAELPKEWRDGRRVIVETAHEEQFVAMYDADSGWCHKWHTDGGAYITDPVHYLDLTIPEVPRG